MLRIENCSKVYENGTIALENVNLTFESKGMVAIVGTSGCGKSTLINLLSANDMQTGGELFYNDIDYNEFGKEMLINEFGYIYQDFKLIDNLTCLFYTSPSPRDG
ncbi:MAG: ATP-binding cassette domain-containing protein, partial [Clostridia bacterium]|nr:ATP-binding cassette domain-containing protein [Clostridia bacterium]